jgi:hypothetical protein
MTAHSAPWIESKIPLVDPFDDDPSGPLNVLVVD